MYLKDFLILLSRLRDDRPVTRIRVVPSSSLKHTHTHTHILVFRIKSPNK
jgi:hypothetical protein